MKGLNVKVWIDDVVRSLFQILENKVVEAHITQLGCDGRKEIATT